MPKLPVLSAREVIGALRRLGFVVVRQSGSHAHLLRGDDRPLVTVPNHPELAKGTLLSILRQARITREELLANL